MILRIDHDAPEPLYLQIRDELVGAIARGELEPGDRLPGVRALAADLGVNLHTVNKAYAVLRDEGYLLMRGRSGAFVADAPVRRRVEAEERAAAVLRKLALEWRAGGGDARGLLDLAATEVGAVYADPGIAGARREVRVTRRDVVDGRPPDEPSDVASVASAGMPAPAASR